MKKYLFFFLLLAIGMMSCQKDIAPPFLGNAALPLKSAFDSQTFGKPTAESRADEERIVAFSKLLQELKDNPSNSLNGNEMPVDETVWNIEALMNASYASAGDPFAQSALKKDSILVPLNANGAVDQSSLLTIYQSVRVKLAEQYSAVSNSNKHLVFIDIELKGIRNTVNFANPEMMASFEITSLTGFDEPQDMPEDMPFGADDNWIWDDTGGKCNPLTGAVVGNQRYGATKELRTKLNMRYPRPNSRLYFVNVQSYITRYELQKERNTNDAADLDNIRDYLIFEISNEYPLSHPGLNYEKYQCISADDMNWYYQNYHNLITKYKNQYNKDFVSIFIQPTIHAHIDDQRRIHSIYGHYPQITYGSYHLNNCVIICSCTDPTCIPNPYCFVSY